MATPFTMEEESSLLTTPKLFVQSQGKQFESGQAITKGAGFGGPPLENFEKKKNAACWRILVILYYMMANNMISWRSLPHSWIVRL